MLRLLLAALLVGLIFSTPAHAATTIPLTVTLSEPVNVVTTSGTPRIALDVGGVTRYASYASGSGTASLTFNYATQAGDVDLDGITVSSPIQLNGGAIADLSGNPMVNLTFTPPNTSTVKVNYPSLGMDFVADVDGRYTLNGTVYNTLPAFLTATGGSFTRNSIGTYYDSTGTLQTATANTPRFDHDPVTNARKGILIEESRTNLLLRSSEFENVYWFASETTLSPNAVLSPENTATADKIIEGTSNDCHSVLKGVTYAGPAIVTGSVYLKAAENTKAGLTLWNGAEPTFGGGICGGGSRSAVFDLSTGTVIFTDSASINASIRPVGNGWYRASITSKVTLGSGTQFRIQTAPNTATTSSNLSYLGNGTSGMYAWGAQFEAGAFPTSYIPTTTAAVTRAADGLAVPYASWFDASKGTWTADAYNSQNSALNGRIIGTNGTASANFIAWQGVSGTTIESWNGSNVFTTSVSPVATASVSAKLAMKWATSGPYRSLVANGGTVSTNTFPPAPGTSFYVGAGPSSDYVDSWVRKVKYYPVDVPNTQLQLLAQ